jgi:hypothetical protein
MKLCSVGYSGAANMHSSFYSDPALLFSLGRFAEHSGPAPHHSSPATLAIGCLLQRLKTSYFFHRAVTQL